MYHLFLFVQSSMVTFSFVSIASKSGTGYSPVDFLCATHAFLETAHVLNLCTAGDAYKSPHRI